jgi:molybdate transport system substrate-binding protein
MGAETPERNAMTNPEPLRGISSMATRQVLAELVLSFSATTRLAVELVSVGGVDAARRVRAGEHFDLVVLAADAIDTLIAEGLLQAEGRRALVDSAVAVAVPAAARRPDIGSEQALQRTLLAARAIGYSTGPSGNALLRLFECWGLAEQLRPRLVQARPGVPVGQLVAAGEVDIGFQQLSELMQLDGIALLGGMPPGLDIVTTFVGAVTTASTRAVQARALLDFMAGPDTAALKQRHGMAAAASR